MTRVVHKLTLVSAALLLGASHVVAVTLGLQPIVSLDDSSEIQLPIQLDTQPGDVVASLQFDVHFDTEQFQFRRVETGAAATNADKSAHFNQIRPDVIRVVVAGLNRTVIAPGILARVVFDRVSGESGTTSLRMDGAILSDPFGTAVPATLSPNTLVLEARGDTLHHGLATGTAQATIPGRGYNTYPALIVALLGVGAAMFWARKAPRKRGRR